MNLKEFSKFKENNNFLFGFYLTNKNTIVSISKEEIENRNHSDEVKKYRTTRFNCQRTGTIISKLKIKL